MAEGYNPPFPDGSTAFVVYIWKETLFSACAGDTKGYLFTDQGIVSMQDNETRRALGHLHYKKDTQDNESGVKLTPIPCLRRFDLGSNIRFFVIGTWTFWDAIPSEEVMDYVASQTRNIPDGQTLESVVRETTTDLVYKAGQKNNQPNMSCIVGVFRWKDA